MVLKSSWLYVSWWENDQTFHTINDFSKQFLNDFMFSVPNFKSTLIQQGVHFVNNDHIDRKIENNAGSALSRG